MNNSLPIEPGARFLHPHTGHFLLWAPRGNQAILRLVGPVHRDIHMTRHDHGYWEATVDGIHPGQRYFYRLDNGPDRPDPASRAQPDGVHGPSAVVNTSFDWHDNAWTGAPLDSLVLYELHVGTFTPQGTFDAVLGQLDRLCDLGVTALSLMPVAQFPGWRNWGYDGVYPFCVQNSYGGPAGLKRLVDAAHARGLSVLLDIVYNHLGPEGNYFRYFGPYFTDNYRTPWGEPLNFDSHGCDAVRDFFLANARMWQVEFHLDGLRIDAVPWIKDFSASHLLADLADQARALIPHTRRPFHLIGESDMNDPRVIRPPPGAALASALKWVTRLSPSTPTSPASGGGLLRRPWPPGEPRSRYYQDLRLLAEYSHTSDAATAPLLPTAGHRVRLRSSLPNRGWSATDLGAFASAPSASISRRSS
ncbi:MAG: alpha-amylase family glycosyl hydrolase [Gemmataceae bacterium]